jgi:Tfp pilus assembly protein PilO
MNELKNPEPQNFNRYYVSVRKVWDKPSVRRFSEATATLFLIAFFLFVALKPTIETIFTLNKKISDARETEAQMTKKIADINTAMSLFQSIEADLPLLEESIPSGAKAEDVIDIINQNLNKTHLDKPTYSLGSYSLGKDPIKSNEAATYIANVTAGGSYLNIMNFIQNFSDAKRLIVPSNITLGKTKEESVINFVIRGPVYYEKK